MAERSFHIRLPGEQPELRGQGIDPTDFDREVYTQFQTWLGETKSSEGCPVNCTYCFFKLDGQTPKRPDILLSPEETILALKEVPTYHPDIPVHFGSQTDAFSTRETTEHYTEVLRLYQQSEYPNPLVFITKRRIPEEFMDLAARGEQPVLFYISYSGLNGTGLERTVKEQHQRDNFTRLHARGLPAVHYWRPFLPQNSSPEKIDDILSFVSQYATCSVVNGLRLNDGIRANIAPFWPEVMDEEIDFHTSGEIWPAGVRDFIQTHVVESYPDYPVFFGNTPCSITYTTHQADVQGLFGGRMCLESNCPDEQRDTCSQSKLLPTDQDIDIHARRMNIDPEIVTTTAGKIVIADVVETSKLVYLRYALKAPIESRAVAYGGGHNWANVTDDISIREIPWSAE